MQWFYIRDGQRFGPVEEAELIQLAREGRLHSDDLVWNSTMGQEWKPASSVPDLFPVPAVVEPSGIPGATLNRDLMRQARKSLQGQWAIAIGVSLLYQVVIGGANALPYLGIIIVLLISGPLSLGWNQFFLNLVRRRSVDVGQLFNGFHWFGKSLAAFLLMHLFILLWSLLAVIPALFAGIAIWQIENPEGIAVLLAPLLVALFVLSLVPAIRASLAYSQLFFILADHPECGAMESLRRSQDLMDGFKWKYFCLGLRFLGWILLSFFTCFIGMLWIFPYMKASYARFYDDIRTR